MGTHDTTQKPRQPGQTTDQGTRDPREEQAWQDPATRAKQQGDRTDKAMPSGTTPLERDQRPINQQR